MESLTFGVVPEIGPELVQGVRLIVRNGDRRLAEAQLFRTDVHGFDASTVSLSLIGSDRAHAITAD